MKQKYWKRLMASACSVLMCGSLVCNTMLYTDAAPVRQIESVESEMQTANAEPSEQTSEQLTESTGIHSIPEETERNSSEQITKAPGRL